PGLKSRFKIYYEFADYLPQELSEIAEYTATLKEVTFDKDAKELIDEIIVNAFRSRDRTFGNARFVHDLVEKAKINLGLRIMSSSKPGSLNQSILANIKLQDVEKIEINRPKILPNIPIDYKELEASLNELNALIGIQNIKDEILDLVNLVKYYKESGKSVLNNFYLHTIFIGNPGTGKTTVARILTKIYKALGVLERGHMIETDRQGLVAGFVGQTALKTAQKIEEAMGGVLFIDEAYALSNPNALNDFGNEVIQTILKRMEDHRGEFFIFAAGYPDNMEAFLKTNPGLKSRFDKILRFEDYSPESLLKIAEKMIKDEGMTITQKALRTLNTYFTYLYNYRDKYFGNARTVRNIVQQAIQNQNLRLISNNSKIKNNTISFEDVQNFKEDNDEFIFNKKSIGFRSSN
ncbi:MAG: AAA family ATPase, partial [Bacteroidota bacterium]